MTQLVKLEKRFENALEKLELALANKQVGNVSSGVVNRDKDVEEKSHKTDDLLIKIGELEKAAKSDAEEIDKLVNKLEQIFRD